jgi:hypothetical protein
MPSLRKENKMILKLRAAAKLRSQTLRFPWLFVQADDVHLKKKNTIKFVNKSP